MPRPYTPKGPGEYGSDEIDELVRLGTEHHWIQNHLSQDVTASGAQRIMVRGEGTSIYDIAGNEYIDAMAGLFLANIGHGRQEVVDAVAAQLSQLQYINSGAYSNVPAILLAEHIAQKAPGDLSRVFFSGGGSEAVEIAIKMAKQYHFEGGNAKKTKIISRRNQYHGSTYAAMSVGGKRQYKGVFDPMMGGVVQIDMPYWYRSPFSAGDPRGEHLGEQAAQALENAIEHEGPDTIAAFIATPVQNGNMFPPPDYWPRIREICTKHNILMVADEIICGFGRLGRWFGLEHWGVAPDIMTIAKALTSGYLPVGATVASKEVGDRFRQGPQDTFMHGVTYGSHPAVMAAGLAVQRIIDEENLVERSARMGALLYEQVSELTDRHPSMGFVGGGWGLLMNIEMVKNRATKEKIGGSPDSEYANVFTTRLRERGLAIRGGDNVVLSPPLSIDAETVGQIVGILDATITDMEKDFPTEDPFNEPVYEYPYLDRDWWKQPDGKALDVLTKAQPAGVPAGGGS